MYFSWINELPDYASIGCNDNQDANKFDQAFIAGLNRSKLAWQVQHAELFVLQVCASSLCHSTIITAGRKAGTDPLRSGHVGVHMCATKTIQLIWMSKPSVTVGVTSDSM